MSFADHNYGGVIHKYEDSVITCINDFLSKVYKGASVQIESRQCEDVEFFGALQALIQSLQTNLKHLQSQSSTVDDEVIEVNNRSCSITETDPELIQVHADNDEIQRRISAFMERKQKEVDDINKREFCSSFGSNESDESCARTDAVYIPTPGARSHVKVSRVVNRFGPQVTSKDQFKQPNVKVKTEADVEERIKNMEDHLKIKEPGVKKMQLFERIKKLEERILTLESVSPEYVDLITQSTDGRSRKEKKNYNQKTNEQEMTMTEIDDRISQLRRYLKRKSTQNIT